MSHSGKGEVAKLTDAWVKGLRWSDQIERAYGKRGEFSVKDAECAGLFLRVGRGPKDTAGKWTISRKTYVYRGKVGAVAVAKKIGSADELTVDEARDKVVTLRGVHRKGVDPFAAKSMASWTLQTAYDEYLKTIPETSVTKMEDAKALWRFVPSTWVNLDVSKIDKAAIQRRLTELAAGAVKVPGTRIRGGRRRANTVRSFLKQVFDLAMANDKIAKNPVTGTKRAKEDERDVFLTVDDARALVAHLRTAKPHEAADARQARLLMLFLIYTGARPIEAYKMKWGDVHKGVWVKYDTKTEDTKRIPLSATALAVLGEVGKRGADQMVFPRLDEMGLPTAKRHRNLNKYWAKVRRALALYDYTMYDCTRKTFASLALLANVPVTATAKALGNTPKTLMQYYAKAHPEDARKAAEAIEKLLGTPTTPAHEQAQAFVTKDGKPGLRFYFHAGTEDGANDGDAD